MTTVMTPSTITVGQIAKIQELLGSALRKSPLSSEAVQTVIEQQGDLLIEEMVSAFRSRVDAVSCLVVRTIIVNRTRAPEEALVATGRKQYVTDSVVKTMPKIVEDTVEIVFFNLGRYVKDDQLEKEYAYRGLIPADPYALAAVNEAEPAFADERPNCTHWKNAQNKWCYAAFNHSRTVRSVTVGEYGSVWHGLWWFAGSRKVSRVKTVTTEPPLTEVL